MDRRRFVAMIGGALAAPLVRAQQPGRRYRIGVLLPLAESAALRLPVIRERLAAHGFVEGRNLALDVRYARTDVDAARDLVALKPDAMLAVTAAAAQAAQLETKTVSIVFAWVADPVLSGLVKDYARPGGNITGVTDRQYELAVKRLELLRDLLPAAKRVAVAGGLFDPVSQAELRFTRQAAQRLGIELIVRSDISWDWVSVIQGFAAAGAQSMLVLNSYAMRGDRFGAENAIRAANLMRMPAVYRDTESVEMGGLMSYATNLNDDLKRAIDLIVQVLKGRLPSEIPVEQASRFELAVNLTTAKMLGLKLPHSILLRADRVIE